MDFIYSGNPDEIVAYLKTLQGKWSVTIEKPSRTIEQNATYWNNIEILSQHSGYSKDEMSAIIKNGITRSGKLEMMTYKEVKGEIIQVPKETKKLNTKDFGILMDYVFQIGATLGLQMKIPDDGLIEYANELFNSH